MKALIVFSLVLSVAVATPALIKDAYDFIKDLANAKIEPPKVSEEMPKITMDPPKQEELPKLENPPEIMVDPPKPEEGDDLGPMDPEMFAIFANYADPLPGQQR